MYWLFNWLIKHFGTLWDTFITNSTQLICDFYRGSELLYKNTHTQTLQNDATKDSLNSSTNWKRNSSFKCNYLGGHTWVHMLGKYLLNKYDKLATTHLLWTPWGFYCNVTKSSDSKGLREFLSLSACLDSCHFQWPSIAPTARTITLCVCYFFSSHPSQERRTEITTARKTAASLSISGKSKESF